MLFTSTEPVAQVASWWDQFWSSWSEFFLAKDEKGLNYLTRIIVAIIIIVVAFFLIKLVCYLLKKALGVKRRGPDVDLSARFFIVQVVKVLLWILVAFLVINMLKIDTTGIAGVTSAITVALGLALQDLVMAFASGLLIIHQKSILAGEFIGVKNSYGTTEGTVDKVHIFFTYLKTPGGQMVSIPNSAMLKAVVINYTRTGRRRLDYDVGVAYDTDIALAKQVLYDLVKGDQRIYEGEEPTVYVYELGAYAVGIRLRMVMKTDEYWPMFNELSERVLLAFREHNIYIPSSTDRAIMK